MTKLIKPISLFLIALTIVSGAGYWWFSRAPLASEFIAIIPDQAYIDWEADKLPTVDQNNDHIADALLMSTTSSTQKIPVLISLTYDEQAKTTVGQLEKLLPDQSTKFYPATSVMVATADLPTIRQIANLSGVVMVEEDINVAGLTRAALAAYPIAANSPIQTAGVALIDGGTNYDTTYREALVEPAGAGLIHGNIVATNLLQVDPTAKIVDVAVLDSQAKAPVSRVIAGIDWTIANKDKYDIATMNVSAGYTGKPNFAFNRALSAAAVEGLAVVVSIADSTQAGQVAARVPGMVRVASYDATQTPPTGYNKNLVDILAPVDGATGSSAAAAKLSGAVSQLIAGSETGQAGTNTTDWWTTLSTTVINVNDVITLTPDQLNSIAGGDQQAIDEFMKPLSGYLKSAIDQLQTELGGSAGTDIIDNQALLDLLNSALNLTDISSYATDINLGGYSTDINDLWNELWNDLGN